MLSVVFRIRSLILSLFLLCTVVHYAHAQGVGVVDASTETYLLLDANLIDVHVEDQVAIVTSTQRFKNTTSDSTTLTFAFPLAEGASPIGIRWLIDNVWYRGSIAPVPQDTTLPGEGGTGGGGPVPLDDYLGETPLLFDIEQVLEQDSSIVVELRYVQLLPYEFGKVDFRFPNRYEAVQATPVPEQSFTFNLSSARTINDLALISHEGSTIENNGLTATLAFEGSERPLDMDYAVQYSLSLDELGLFGFSTWFPDSLIADEGGPGFFTFVAEPDASDNTEVISKVFTLVLDRSGSMSGTKIIQARDAASFIVRNLNEGDRFNIIDFSTSARSFMPEHVPFNADNMEQAIDHIRTLNPGGSTNISEALLLAIDQFSAASENTANLIIFFTDGRANRGVSDTEGILRVVEEAANQNENNPIIYTFGIGNDVDTRLLSLLARNNNGLVEFLGNDELEERITDFYLRVRNPVLLNTSISFDRTGIQEIFPAPLPNLAKGQQMIVSGRYDTPGPINITLSGDAFGAPVSYEYTLNLADSAVAAYQFLPRIWAKQKIDQLLIAYYGLNASSSEAKALRDEVIAIGVAYGIVTPFTSFQGGEEEDDGSSAVSVEEDPVAESPRSHPAGFEILGNYPNPFREFTHLQLRIEHLRAPVVRIRIYDSLGRLVRTLEQSVHSTGTLDVEWDGLTDSGVPVSTGIYLILVEFGDAILAHPVSVVR